MCVSHNPRSIHPVSPRGEFLLPFPPSPLPSFQAPGPAVLFASPGNLTSGVSLEAFRAWAGSARNLLVLAGYQVRGEGSRGAGGGFIEVLVPVPRQVWKGWAPLSPFLRPIPVSP